MKNKFSWKAFVSLGLTYSFIFIVISGILLYVSPPGRYAHWVNWKILGFTKESWQAIHTVFSFAFVILSVFHLFTINWKVFLSYLKLKKQRGLNKQREFYISTGLALILFFGIIYSVPPFKSVMDLGGYFTNSWEKVEEAAPVPHAELLTLDELVSQLKLSSADEIAENLKIHEIKFDNTHTQTLKEIAKANDTTPQKIYEVIIRKSASQHQGHGIAKKTIEDFASEIDKSAEELFKTLKGNNIKVKKGQTLREIGGNNNISPNDIYKLITQ